MYLSQRDRTIKNRNFNEEIFFTDVLTLNNQINKVLPFYLLLSSKFNIKLGDYPDWYFTVVKNMPKFPHWVYSLISQSNLMGLFTFWQE